VETSIGKIGMGKTKGRGSKRRSWEKEKREGKKKGAEEGENDGGKEGSRKMGNIG